MTLSLSLRKIHKLQFFIELWNLVSMNERLLFFSWFYFIVEVQTLNLSCLLVNEWLLLRLISVCGHLEYCLS
jgi:hypothetical protein